jgi:hypothetical protein
MDMVKKDMAYVSEFEFRIISGQIYPVRGGFISPAEQPVQEKPLVSAPFTPSVGAKAPTAQAVSPDSVSAGNAPGTNLTKIGANGKPLSSGKGSKPGKKVKDFD